MAYCIGTYPKPIARLIRWVIRRNPTRTVKCVFRGRVPKNGMHYRYGSIPQKSARRVSIYLIEDPHAPVNKEHARILQKQQRECDVMNMERAVRRLETQRQEKKIEPAECHHVQGERLYCGENGCLYLCTKCNAVLPASAFANLHT